jgi:hypothetical protein
VQGADRLRSTVEVVVELVVDPHCPLRGAVR